MDSQSTSTTGKPVKSKKVPAPRKRQKSGGIQSKIQDFKRDEILTVAARLFFRNGYSSTTLDAIAAELGVTKPFIYSHFEGKQDILNQLFYRMLDTSLAAFNDFQMNEYSPTEGLRELVMRFVHLVITTRDGVGFFWRRDKDLPPMDKKRAKEFRIQFEAPFLQVLRLGISAHEFDIPDPSLAMKCIEGMVHWPYVWYQPEGRLTENELAKGIADLVLAMVRGKNGMDINSVG